MNENMSFEIEEGVKTFPWRRFLARSLDSYVLRMSILVVFMLYIGDTGYTTRYRIKFELIMIENVMVLFLEPALLALTGTTLGKFILGIQVTGKDGRHLSYKEAFFRTAKVLVFGTGLGLYIVDIICGLKSYNHYKEGNVLKWDENCIVSLKDENKGRFVTYAFVVFLVVALFFLVGYKVSVSK